MTSPVSHPLSADRPVDLPSEDRLGYARFAENLARAIRERAPSDGIVLALHGSWGSGKSTVLALVQHFLEQAPSTSQPTVVHFNPWWFSSRDDLLRRFFDQLIVRFAAGGAKFKKLREQVAALAGLVGGSPVPYAEWVKSVGKLVSPGERSVHDLRKHVEELLRALEAPVVIIVDDIDRLSLPEIRDLFRLIKAVANFPNVVYLLAFDRLIVANALSGEFGESGDEYLEKIVQVPFELPAPEKAAIWQILFERLDQAIKDTPEEYFTQTHWGNVFGDLIADFIETPRDAVRLGNAVSVTYPAVRGEVNAVDFIGLETLRLFCPPAYAAIRDNAERFAGPSGERTHQKPEDQAFQEAWLSKLPQNRQVQLKAGLPRLFPRLEWVWGNTVWGREWESKWKRAGRICSQTAFPTFFALQLGEGLFSRSRLQALLGLHRDAEQLKVAILELINKRRPDGSRHIRHFLSAVHEFISDLPEAQARTLLRALADIGDEIIQVERDERGFFDIPIFWTFRSVVYLATKTFDASGRLSFVLELVNNGKALCFLMTAFGLLWAPPRNEERLIEPEGEAKAKAALLERIDAASENGTLEDVPALGTVLLQWEEIGGEEKVRAWVDRQTARDDFFVKLCRGYTSVAASVTMGQRGQSMRRQVDAEGLFRRIDRATVETRATTLLGQDSLSAVDKEVLKVVVSAAKTGTADDDDLEEES